MGKNRFNIGDKVKIIQPDGLIAKVCDVRENYKKEYVYDLEGYPFKYFTESELEAVPMLTKDEAWENMANKIKFYINNGFSVSLTAANHGKYRASIYEDGVFINMISIEYEESEVTS